jgi:hypothetical protein
MLKKSLKRLWQKLRRKRVGVKELESSGALMALDSIEVEGRPKRKEYLGSFVVDMYRSGLKIITVNPDGSREATFLDGPDFSITFNGKEVIRNGAKEE